MRSQAIITFFITLLTASLFFACSLPFGAAQASTEISGIINSDMTWTKAAAPFIFTGPVLLSSGATITIQPGVSVIMGSYYLQINGTLRARGNATDPIRFTTGTSGIVFTSFSTSWNEQNATGSIIENAVFTDTIIDIQNSSPKISNNNLTNTKVLIDTQIQGNPIIFNNTINSKVGALAVPGISCSGNATITANKVSGWNMGIYVVLGNPTIENNLVFNNTGSASAGGGGIRVDNRISYPQTTSPTIDNNTITNNTAGINLFGSPTPKIIYNNIQDNTNFNLYLYNGGAGGIYPSGGDANATYNWWGTNNLTAVNQTIYDFKRDINLGTVTFAPILNASNPNAPALPTSPVIPEIPTPATVAAAVTIIIGLITAQTILVRKKKRA